MLRLLIFLIFILLVNGQDILFPNQLNDYQNPYQSNQYSTFRPLQSPNIHYSHSNGQAKFNPTKSSQTFSSTAQIAKEREYWSNHVSQRQKIKINPEVDKQNFFITINNKNTYVIKMNLTFFIF